MTESGINGGGLTVREAGNILVRNLNLTNADGPINIEEASHHVWIDHNTPSRSADGPIDIKRGSDFITVSWNRTFDTGKSMLLGTPTTTPSRTPGTCA